MAKGKIIYLKVPSPDTSHYVGATVNFKFRVLTDKTKSEIQLKIAEIINDNFDGVIDSSIIMEQY